MSQAPSTLRSAPIGMAFFLIVGAALYVALLVNASAPLAGGDAAFGQGWAIFMLALGLWTVLALLLVIGGVNGHMPRWAAISLFFLHPLSGVAAAVALDAASRNVGGAMAIVVSLPLTIAGYAVWARMPRLRDAYPFSGPAVGAILVLSGIGLLTGL